MFSNELILNILDYIDNNLYSRITIDDFENKFNYNKDYIMRVFKREIGITIIEYINKKRIFNSLESLKNNNFTLLNVSINYGFTSLEYYSETFKKIIGVAPSRYRLFSQFDYSISYDEVDKIRDSITELGSFFNKVNNYKLNVKPSRYVKTLSVFR